MIYLISTMKIKKGSEEICRNAALMCRTQTLKETGCITYDFFQNTHEPDMFVFVERWQDRAAIDLHFNTPHLQAWRAIARAHILSRKIEIIAPEKIESLE